MDDKELRMQCLQLADRGISRDRDQMIKDAAVYYAFITGAQPGMAAFIPEEQRAALFSGQIGKVGYSPGGADQSTDAAVGDVAWKDMR
jgi:hypothetical protein